MWGTVLPSVAVTGAAKSGLQYRLALSCVPESYTPVSTI